MTKGRVSNSRSIRMHWVRKPGAETRLVFYLELTMHFFRMKPVYHFAQ